jgi:hypothetical protein
MLGWILQISILSIAIIFLVHHIIYFLKNSLTVPKVKDLVALPSKKYQDIFNTITQPVEEEPASIPRNIDDIQEIHFTDIQSLPTEENASMKNELKNFLKKQLQENSSSSIEPAVNKNPFSDLETISNSNNQYAPF